MQRKVFLSTTLSLALISLSFSTLGCDSEKKIPAPERKHTSTSAGDRVKVAQEGTQFAPPVKPSQIPPGAWMCNMGDSVHYASMGKGKGKGKCPTCGMKLTQKNDSGENAHAH